MKQRLLLIGILLSLLSKYIQWQTQAIVGDVLILVAGPFLLLALLFYLPAFTKHYPSKTSKQFALLLIMSVFWFQCFTMVSFGWNNHFGFVFLPLVLIFTTWTLWSAYQLFRKEV
ncbi:MAG: hypothetical protein ACRCZJ_03355 [Erysipelotrichaceae bacterium]